MNAAQEKQFLDYLNEYSGIMHRICKVYFPDADDRKDAFQEIVFQLWKSFPSFRGESKISTWIYRVALNTAMTHDNKRRVANESMAEYRIAPEQEKEDEQLQKLYAAINVLPSVDRALILLQLEGNSYEDIADITGLTKTNVSVRLVRIRKKLEEIIKNQMK